MELDTINRSLNENDTTEDETEESTEDLTNKDEQQTEAVDDQVEEESDDDEYEEAEEELPIPEDSPAFQRQLRSRGSVPDQPRVQSTPIEYKSKKKWARKHDCLLRIVSTRLKHNEKNFPANHRPILVGEEKDWIHAREKKSACKHVCLQEKTIRAK